jgi:hypothetical protein
VKRLRVAQSFRGEEEEIYLCEVVNALIRGLQAARGVNRAGACVRMRGKRGIVKKGTGRTRQPSDHQSQASEWVLHPSACTIRPAYSSHLR